MDCRCEMESESIPDKEEAHERRKCQRLIERAETEQSQKDPKSNCKKRRFQKQPQKRSKEEAKISKETDSRYRSHKAK